MHASYCSQQPSSIFEPCLPNSKRTNVLQGFKGLPASAVVPGILPLVWNRGATSVRPTPSRRNSDVPSLSVQFESDAGWMV